MNLSTLIKQYFSTSENDVTIDVFDEKNIYDVYHRVVSVLTQHLDIETTVLEAMSYCFYEILIRGVMVTFSFREYGENLGTRPLGKRVREQLMPLLEQDERVVLDFTGVNVVSNSFADECIAKLLLTMPLSELKSRTTFRGLNPIASESVLTALQRRHLVTA